MFINMCVAAQDSSFYQHLGYDEGSLRNSIPPNFPPRFETFKHLQTNTIFENIQSFTSHHLYPIFTMVNWQVISFSASTSAAGEKFDVFYANGRMQVVVNVQIKASIPGSNSDPIPYTLSDNGLASIRPIDYCTHAELTSNGNGWVWSCQKSQFAGTLCSMGTAEFQVEVDSQLVQFGFRVQSRRRRASVRVSVSLILPWSGLAVQITIPTSR
jgi:hypothetical protein